MNVFEPYLVALMQPTVSFMSASPLEKEAQEQLQQNSTKLLPVSNSFVPVEAAEAIGKVLELALLS